MQVDIGRNNFLGLIFENKNSILKAYNNLNFLPLDFSSKVNFYHLSDFDRGITIAFRDVDMSYHQVVRHVDITATTVILVCGM